MNATAIAAILIALCAFCTNTFAQSTQEQLKQAQDTLKQAQRRLPQLETLSEELKVELESFTRKLETAEQDLAQSNRDAAKAQALLQESKVAHEANPNQDTDRALRKAEHGYAMAERGVKNRNKRVERIQGKHQQLLLSSERNAQQQKTLGTQIKNQRVQIQQLEARLHEEKQKATQLAASAASAKVEQQAQLERQQREQAEKLAQQRQAEAKKAELTQTMAKKDPVTQEIKLSAEDQSAQRKAQKLLAEVNQQIADKPGRRPLYKRLTLKGQQLPTVPFTFIGANYYRAETRVSSGQQFFEIAKNRFKRDLPESDDGQVYVFIYQAKSASRGVLQYYKKSLLDN
ncbi:hypothetical protein [Pseudoteredinibacter isoporae]|uniref:DNA repair exonuclease SbcCD ATPase subunit n=1 Tax=Pseudoteredinibacter isoporae TaxID=570281 RepID=A0A7X0JTK5_9GAMM|nr:hypothetical protein [Pseudoteredinibacter isoporae]MBB6521994.1 DNA repair exonuclease SbcCD ATPase subunit [Pseudoteredinibacter isoporae]NHO87530.1 hypothetical protein [Pseudoteredinibacter isoporae]NIB24139.1 hypothetical protein [Pseudoteredinibacter isoporae]